MSGPTLRESSQGPDHPARVVRALFVASGAATLAQEVLWMRRFAELLGATASAAAATLTGVFLGFALGGFLAARFAARCERPLRAYGLLELLAAGGGLLVLPLADGAATLLPGVRAALAGAPLAARACEMLLAAAIVAVPATSMGATLPLVAPLFGAGGGRSLYAWNLVGAVAGALAVPFALLGWFGVGGSVVVAAATGAAAGVVALALDRARPWRRAEPPVAATAAAAAEEAEEGRPLPERALAFASGALLLGLESAYVRLFAQLHWSSLHAFASVVAAFLVALALGALLARWLVARELDRGVALAIAWLAAGGLLAAVPQLLHGATDGLAPLKGSDAERLGQLIALAAWLLVPPVALASAALPLLLGPRRRAPDGAALGRLLGWNTLGSLLGPSLATFVLFPTVGLHATFALAAALLIATAGALLVARVAPRSRRSAGLASLLALAAVAGFAWRAPSRVRVDPKNGEELVELVEGPLAIAAVVAHPAGPAGGHSYHLKVDNHYTLGGTGTTGDLRQLGHLPLLLHPAPKRVAFLGLGTAITAGAATLHPVESIDAVELLPEVVALARRHFAAQNLGLLDDPRTHLRIDDARTFLRDEARGALDVIVGDLVVPWRAGESALYTREHFEQARAALAPGGLFCQWLPAYQLREEQLDAIVATFLDVFPRATLWRGDFIAALPTLGLVGHTADVDPAAVAARAAALAPKLDATSPYLMHPAGVWLDCLGPLDPRAPRWRDARRHTGDRPWLELAGPERGAGAGTRTLTGHALDRLIVQLMLAPLEGTPLAKMGPDERAWREAGAKLWTASLFVLDGEGAAATELALTTLRGLPRELREAVRGPDGR